MRRLVTSLVTLLLAAARRSPRPRRPALREGTRTADTKLTLVAYSTPREAYGQLIPLFQKTAAGKDVSFDQSYGASASRAARCSAGLTADVVALSLEPDVTELVAKGLVDKNWNERLLQGHGHELGRRLRRPRRQPEEDPNWNDLIKPGVEVITPNPITSGGARWNVMAAYGAQRKLGKTHKQAQRLPEQALPARHRAGQERARVAADVPRRQGRRAARLRERGHLREQEGPEDPVRDPALDDPDREPGRGGQERPSTPREANAFVNFLRTPAAQKIFGENGYRPGRQERREAVHVPGPARPLHDRPARASAAGRRSRRSSSTRRTASSR